MGRLIKRITGNFENRYQKASIQLVISVSFTVVAVLGMLFIGMTLFFHFSNVLENTLEENSQRILTQVNLNLDNYLRRMMHISDAVYYRVIKNADLSEDSFLDGMDLVYEENRDSLVSIAVFDEKGELISAVPLPVRKESAVPQDSDWFRLAMERMENLHFSTPHIQRLFDDLDNRYHWVVSLSRHVQLTQAGVTKSGVLLVDMNFRGIEQVCQEADFSNGGYLYVIDNQGELIYHPKQQFIYSGLLEENNLQAAKYRDGTYTETFQGQKRQVTVKTVGYTGWRLVGVVPSDDLLADTHQMLYFGLALLLFSAFMLAFLNFRLSDYISTPIKRLERYVKELENGGSDPVLEEGGCYEVQRLGHAIRSMVSTMRHLMDDIIEQESQKRRSELDVLQSQINPHFLYNTLDSVIWMTEAGHYDESIQMVTSLARLFRISLSKGKSVIPLADELEHARQYMNIQQIRYKNRFAAEIVAGPGTEGLYALKLIIQPLLENAIYHGMAAPEEDGLIRVEARRAGDDLVIEVSDNGCGMLPEVAASLLDENSPAVTSKGSGIGVRNVHKRIRLTFGAPYGLTIRSEPDEGTTVLIRLPVLDQQAAEACQRGGNP